MLNYSFGLHLDGHFSPASIREAGSIICGPMSLLGHLETALGIPPPKGRYLQRLMDYLRAMEQVRGEHDFYAKSIEIAPLATARLVLKMRDELREAGWDGLNDRSKPERIASLARVEIPFSRMQGISSCVSRRIETIIKELRSCPKRIAKITVTDPPDLLPRCWVDLLTELNSDFTNPLPRETISSKRTSLAYLQASLLNEASAPPSYDQTVKLITCATREKAAHTLASELSSFPMEGVTLIANTKNQALLNHFLRRNDIPRPSAADNSSDCILQLVLLYLRMRSPKLDAKAYSEFCLHPTSPVPAILGNALADTIQKKPGYGEHWQQALTGVLEKCQPDHQNWIKDSYELWLDRSQLLPELPTGREITIALEPLVDWVSKEAQLASTAQREIWQSAAHSIQELVTTLDCENLPPLEDLDDLLSCWLMSASNGITFNGEVGSVNHVTSASQLLEASDHIIWWCPPPSPPQSSRWLPEELEWFDQSEIKILDVNKTSLLQDEIATRAILMARKSLTIYHVAQTDGKLNPQASIHTRIKSYFEGSGIAETGIQVESKDIPVRPLQKKRRWWNFRDGNLFPSRKIESFSSLNKVVYAPYIWALDYHANIRPGPIFRNRVKESPSNKGSLLHHLAERIFDHGSGIDWRTVNEKILHQKIDELFAELCRTEASYYLMPGLEVAKGQLVYNAKRAFWKLITILQNSGIEEISMEEEMDPITFCGTNKIGGIIDLIARQNAENTAVVDLKLGGKTTRHDEVANNTHLQLAIYGKLMLENEKTDPATAYFILSNGGTLLSRNKDFFSGVNPVVTKNNSNGPDWQRCWSEFEEIYQWRRRQIDQGKLEVTSERPDSEEPPDEPCPVGHWEPSEHASPYNIYDALIGWNPED